MANLPNDAKLVKVPGVDDSPPEDAPKPKAADVEDDFDDEEEDEGEDIDDVAEEMFDDEDDDLDEDEDDSPAPDDEDDEDDLNSVDDIDKELAEMYGDGKPAAAPQAMPASAARKPATSEPEPTFDESDYEVFDLGEDDEDDDIPVTKGEIKQFRDRQRARIAQLRQQSLRETAVEMINSSIEKQLSEYSAGQDKYRRVGLMQEVWSHIQQFKRTYDDNDIAKVVKMVVRKAELQNGERARPQKKASSANRRSREAASRPRGSKKRSSSASRPKRRRGDRVDLDLSDTRSTDAWFNREFKD
jgi:hypothetical protein